MKVDVLWYAMLCSLVNIIKVHEEPTASAFRLENPEFQIVRWKVPPKFIYLPVRCHIAEWSDTHSDVKLKS
jgi:hypothetical protein